MNQDYWTNKTKSSESYGIVQKLGYLVALTQSWKEIGNTGRASLLALSQLRNQMNSSKETREHFFRNVHKTQAIRIHISEIKDVFKSIYSCS